jgi:hypothetical protein
MLASLPKKYYHSYKAAAAEGNMTAQMAYKLHLIGGQLFDLWDRLIAR